LSVLFTPECHERLSDGSFTEASALDAIRRIVERAEAELDPEDGRWPLDPADIYGDTLRRESGLYCGAAGIAWALGELGSRVDRGLVEGLERHVLDDPDDPAYGDAGVWNGLAGVLAVGEHFWPEAARRDRLAALAQESLESPALEPMFGHPGHMLLAAQLHERTGEERWADMWVAGAERLLDLWEHDEDLDVWLWTQELLGKQARYVGPAHGLVGNIHVLLRGGALLPQDRQAEVEQKAVETLTRLAVVEDDRANWPPGAGDSLVANERIRVQWCHGASGIVTALWPLAPEDDEWGELLLAGGRLVWEAGPIRDSPGLCHGTAGNAYALLALWQRTGDEEWLERARAFAQHAADQVEERAARLGHGHHSLYGGDEGVALCLASCIDGDVRFPVADRLI
jgi:hypothetical protein